MLVTRAKHISQGGGVKTSECDSCFGFVLCLGGLTPVACGTRAQLATDASDMALVLVGSIFWTTRASVSPFRLPARWASIGERLALFACVAATGADVDFTIAHTVASENREWATVPD